MDPIAYLIFIVLVAVVLALLEIQIEGKHGWAGDLPTWRVKKHALRWLFDKDITGYHAYQMLLMLILFHAYLIFIGFSIKAELQALSGFIIMWDLEDFLWFVFNPSYGLKKFKPQYIHWHKHWILGVPVEYISLPIALLVFALASI